MTILNACTKKVWKPIEYTTYIGCFTIVKKSNSLSYHSCWLYSLSFFGWMQRTKYIEIMPWTMEQKMFCLKTYYETKSSKIILARYSKKINFNTFPNRSLIFELVNNFEDQGTYEDRKTTCSSPSPLRRFQQPPSRKVHALSITVHAAFNNAFNWTVSRSPLDIFGSYLHSVKGFQVMLYDTNNSISAQG